MYDNLKCYLPLPKTEESPDSFNFQTKSLACFLDNYEIRADGTLWHEIYDIEDRSDPNAEGIRRMVGMLTRVNRRWEQEVLTGEVAFYDSKNSTWYEYSAYFVEGQLKEFHRLS